MAVMLCQLGFDGIDINMGCPSPSVVHRGSGAGLIQTPRLANAIVKATKQGIVDWCNGATFRDDPGAPDHLIQRVEARHGRLPSPFQQRRAIPVSVKTRIGYSSPQIPTWIPELLESEPAAIAIHGRTLQQGYAGRADWDEIARAAELAQATPSLILGNGDIRSLDDAHHRIETCKLDGVLIGRASYGNPFVFRREHEQEPSPEDKYRLLRIAQEHAQLYEASISRQIGHRFMPMRKHLGWYARNLPGAVGLRRELVQASGVADVEVILERYFLRRQRWEMQKF